MEVHNVPFLLPPSKRDFLSIKAKKGAGNGYFLDFSASFSLKTSPSVPREPFDEDFEDLSTYFFNRASSSTISFYCPDVKAGDREMR